MSCKHSYLYLEELDQMNTCVRDMLEISTSVPRRGKSSHAAHGFESCKLGAQTKFSSLAPLYGP
ncbi:hypothetical protein HanIR_Chr16g0811211 [Helianthus annuus]|nr:hypothetical protein HanIR_Chr16g0811211 [Helianthus annuus]